MAVYVTITDSQLDPDAPLTSQLAYQWRDNPIAMFEGAVGAPRLQLAALDAGFYTADGIGSLAFAAQNGTTSATIVAGTTYAGSGLRFSGIVLNGGVVQLGPSAVGTLTGSWLALGTNTDPSAGSIRATLFMRIA